MTDIQKCPGEIVRNGYDTYYCKVRSTCYRYTAPDDGEYQAWGNPAPDFIPESGCSNIYKRK